jgi:hypothetical protein
MIAHDGKGRSPRTRAAQHDQVRSFSRLLTIICAFYRSINLVPLLNAGGSAVAIHHCLAVSISTILFYFFKYESTHSPTILYQSWLF